MGAARIKRGGRKVGLANGSEGSGYEGISRLFHTESIPLDPRTHGGKIYELAGPEVLTMRQLNQQVAEMAGNDPDLVNVPNFAASAIATLGFLPGAPLSRDQWLMLQKDNVASGEQPGFKAFGITPAPLAATAPEWLGRFRKGGRFAPRTA